MLGAAAAVAMTLQDEDGDTDPWNVVDMLCGMEFDEMAASDWEMTKVTRETWDNPAFLRHVQWTVELLTGELAEPFRTAVEVLERDHTL
jgi:hypothetical protein